MIVPLFSLSKIRRPSIKSSRHPGFTVLVICATWEKLFECKFFDCHFFLFGVSECGDHLSIAGVVTALGNPKKEEMTVKKLTFEQFLPVLSQITKTVKPGCLEDFIEGLRIFDKENN